MNAPSLRTSTRLRLASVAVLPLLALAACGGGDDESASSEPTTAVESPSESPSEEPTEDTDDTADATDDAEDVDATEDAAAAPSGDTPAWAAPTTQPGELLTTIEAGQLSVDVYQVGTATAVDDGFFADPDTNEPVLAKGDTLVVVNYVITNNGDDLDLGITLVEVDAKYDDYPYLGGMDGLTDDEYFEGQGVNEEGIVVGSMVEPGIYTLGAGQSFSYGDNFAYQPGSPITFDVTAGPVDAEGERIDGARIEGEGSATIK